LLGESWLPYVITFFRQWWWVWVLYDCCVWIL